MLATFGAQAGAGRARPAEAAAEAVPEDVLGRGAAVFQRTCAACHGQHAGGRPGTGVDAGPPIDDVEIAYVDLVLRTGRMPIAVREIGVRTERLTAADRVAVVAWMTDQFELPGTLPQPGTGDAGRGLDPFVEHCAACHGAGGTGGVAGGGTFVPPIDGRDPIVIAEAARVGPFAMPAFSQELLPDDTLDDVIAYLEEADTAPRSLLGLREVDEVGTGIAVVVLLGAALGLVHLVADRPGSETPGTGPPGAGPSGDGGGGP